MCCTIYKFLRYTVPAHGLERSRYTGLHPTIEAPFDANTAFVWPTVDEYRKSTEKTAGAGADPRPATAQKGEAVLEAITRNLAEFIENEVRTTKVMVTKPGVPV